MLSQSALRALWGPPCTGPKVFIPLHGSGRVQVRTAIIEAVHALNAQLVRWDYRTRYADTGGYNCRKAVGSNAWSLHAYGTSIDLNWRTNLYSRRLVTDMPIGMVNAICGIRTNNGRQVWNWGGFWSGTKDAMHMEIVCSPGDLATGINYATVGTKPPVITNPTNPTSPEEPEKPIIKEPGVDAMVTINGKGIWWLRDSTIAFIDADLKNKVLAQYRLSNTPIILFENNISVDQARSLGIYIP